MNIFKRAETVQTLTERYERLLWEKTRIDQELVETKILIDRLGEVSEKNFSERGGEGNK